MISAQGDDPLPRQLKALYKENKAAQSLLGLLATLKTAPKTVAVVTILERLKKSNIEIARDELVKLLKILDKELNLGTFVVGRRRVPSRFVWKADPISVAQVAVGQAREIQWLPDKHLPEGIGEDKPEMLEHTYRLRPDMILTFELPSNFTPREAERVSAFIKTLPYEGDTN